ncbi:MAG: hypothetical protein HKN33_18935 [Pyrinomonadaceae bacterium]|nr:hypothetical protein [Pyrinomonadaceae bacterium]
MSEILPSYLVPARFIKLDSLPLDRNGKTDKKALLESLGTMRESETRFEPPKTDFEVLVADVWKEVLQLDEIGVDDNFLDLGGQSLEAIRVMARISESVRLDIPLREIFEKPTVRLLAGEIESQIRSILNEEKL